MKFLAISAGYVILVFHVLVCSKIPGFAHHHSPPPKTSITIMIFAQCCIQKSPRSITEHSSCINKVTTFHEVLMGLWSNEGNYLGYFLVDLFHRVPLCFSLYFLWSDGFHSRSLLIFRITGHLASFVIYDKSSFRQKPKFHHFFYHINMPVN